MASFCNVREIVRDYFSKSGCGGLSDPDSQCVCSQDNLGQVDDEFRIECKECNMANCIPVKKVVVTENDIEYLQKGYEVGDIIFVEDKPTDK